MRGLTLIRPWSDAIVHGGKRVENRTWAPPASVLEQGELVALHAGRKYQRVHVPGWSPPPREESPEGIVAVCIVVRVVRFARELPGSQWRWFDMGPRTHGWVLDDVRALRYPVSCKGALNLWRVPAAVERQVLRAL